MASLPTKKVAAILAAVLQHSSETELHAAAPAAAAPAPCPSAPPVFWAQAGRQAAMHDRVHWQRRHSRSW